MTATPLKREERANLLNLIFGFIAEHAPPTENQTGLKRAWDAFDGLVNEHFEPAALEAFEIEMKNLEINFNGEVEENKKKTVCLINEKIEALPVDSRIAIEFGLTRLANEMKVMF